MPVFLKCLLTLTTAASNLDSLPTAYGSQKSRLGDRKRRTGPSSKTQLECWVLLLELLLELFGLGLLSLGVEILSQGTTTRGEAGRGSRGLWRGSPWPPVGSSWAYPVMDPPAGGSMLIAYAHELTLMCMLISKATHNRSQIFTHLGYLQGSHHSRVS